MDIDLSMPDCSVHAETIGRALIFNRALRRGQMLALGREPQRNLTLDDSRNNLWMVCKVDQDQVSSLSR